MGSSFTELITYFCTLLNEGKEDEVWQKIANWEKSEHLTPKENHYYLLSKGLLFLLGMC